METNAYDKQAPQGGQTSLTMGYVLTRIDQLIEDNRRVQEYIESIRQLDMGEQSPMSQMPDSRGQAIAEIVKAREATNRKLLDLLETMYNDLKPEKPRAVDTTNLTMLTSLVDMVTQLDPDPSEGFEFLLQGLDRILSK